MNKDNEIERIKGRIKYYISDMKKHLQVIDFYENKIKSLSDEIIKIENSK